MKLWPRLPLPRARALAQKFAGRTLAELADKQWRIEPTDVFAPTGGVRVDPVTLRKLRKQLEGAAESAGYPHADRRTDAAKFDDCVLQLLADFDIPFGEAIRAETWAWIAVVLVPHVVKWRWPEKDDKLRIDRFAGPLVRNALGRLWYQSVALDRGAENPDRWLYSKSFTSDQCVALLERPSLAANRRICLSVGKAWVALPKSRRKEEVFRETMKALIVRAGFQRLDVLDCGSLDDAVSDCFAATTRRLGVA